MSNDILESASSTLCRIDGDSSETGSGPIIGQFQVFLFLSSGMSKAKVYELWKGNSNSSYDFKL